MSDSLQPMDCSLLDRLPMGLPRQEYWRGLPFPSLGDLPDPRIEPTSLKSPTWADGFFTSSTTWEAQLYPEIGPKQNDFCGISGNFENSRAKAGARQSLDLEGLRLGLMHLCISH